MESHMKIWVYWHKVYGTHLYVLTKVAKFLWPNMLVPLTFLDINLQSRCFNDNQL